VGAHGAAPAARAAQGLRQRHHRHDAADVLSPGRSARAQPTRGGRGGYPHRRRARDRPRVQRAERRLELYDGPAAVDRPARRAGPGHRHALAIAHARHHAGARLERAGHGGELYLPQRALQLQRAALQPARGVRSALYRLHATRHHAGAGRSHAARAGPRAGRGGRRRARAQDEARRLRSPPRGPAPGGRRRAGAPAPGAGAAAPAPADVSLSCAHRARRRRVVPGAGAADGGAGRHGLRLRHHSGGVAPVLEPRLTLQLSRHLPQRPGVQRPAHVVPRVRAQRGHRRHGPPGPALLHRAVRRVPGRAEGGARGRRPPPRPELHPRDVRALVRPPPRVHQLSPAGGWPRGRRSEVPGRTPRRAGRPGHAGAVHLPARHRQRRRPRGAAISSRCTRRSRGSRPEEAPHPRRPASRASRSLRGADSDPRAPGHRPRRRSRRRTARGGSRRCSAALRDR
jgi:hypothetical protein